MLVGLALCLQLNLIASSTIDFKYNSEAFCDVVRHNNNFDGSLEKQFIFDCARLMSIITDTVYSLDDMVRTMSDAVTPLQQSVIINKHIVNLTVIRKSLLRIKNKYQLSSQLSKIFDLYRNNLDVYYYTLNPSYESYLLKLCNVSLKNSMHTSMYATGSLLPLWLSICCFHEILEVKNSSHRQAAYFAAPSSVAVSGYLLYCAYNKVNDPEYEYELLSAK